MTKTSFKQKAFLVFFGVFFTFLLLEMGLRAGGMVFFAQQEKENQGINFDPQEYRILCIGESTTALGGENSYPFQLEEILNQRRPDKRVEVINKGLVSKTSEDILRQMPEFLLQYKPHLVISMIGINDYLIGQSAVNPLYVKLENFLRSFRVIRLFELLGTHIQYTLKEGGKNFFLHPKSAVSSAPVPESDEQDAGDITKIVESLKIREAALRQAVGFLKQDDPQIKKEAAQRIMLLKEERLWLLLGLSNYYRVRNNYAESEKVLKAALAQDPDDYSVNAELGRCYEAQQQCAKAIPFLKKAVTRNSSGNLAWIELGRCYETLDQEAEVVRAAQEILRLPIKAAFRAISRLPRRVQCPKSPPNESAK